MKTKTLELRSLCGENLAYASVKKIGQGVNGFLASLIMNPVLL